MEVTPPEPLTRAILERALAEWSAYEKSGRPGLSPRLPVGHVTEILCLAMAALGRLAPNQPPIVRRREDSLEHEILELLKDGPKTVGELVRRAMTRLKGQVEFNGSKWCLIGDPSAGEYREAKARFQAGDPTADGPTQGPDRRDRDRPSSLRDPARRLRDRQSADPVPPAVAPTPKPALPPPAPPSKARPKPAPVQEHPKTAGGAGGAGAPPPSKRARRVFEEDDEHLLIDPPTKEEIAAWSFRPMQTPPPPKKGKRPAF
jgi:hypothetical protein